MQLAELIGGLEKEEKLIVKDYMSVGRKRITAEDIMLQLSNLNYEDLMKPQLIAKLLGYENFDNYEELGVYPKGYRILSKIPRMPGNIVENLVKSFKSFQHILIADTDSLDKVEGIGEVRAQTIRQSLKRMQEQYAFENVLF